MREIVFRGKRVDNGEWIVGSLWINIGEPYILTDGNSVGHKVDPETVGQFTGLCDKNGNQIFEGDIVRYNTFDDFDCYSVVRFGNYKQDGSSGEYNPRICVGWYVDVQNFTCPDWAENNPDYFHDYLGQQNLVEVNDDCEVIGTIHDNSELLEGETK